MLLGERAAGGTRRTSGELKKSKISENPDFDSMTFPFSIRWSVDTTTESSTVQRMGLKAIITI